MAGGKFKKGDRVKAKDPKTGEEVHGLARSGRDRQGKLSVLLDDGRSVRGSETAFAPSEKPPAAKWQKGDRVSITEEGETYHATIAKGGSGEVHAVIDGGEQEVRALAPVFAKSDKPLPKDEPSPMDRYSVKGYKEHKELSEETPAFTATILRDGKPVAEAKNAGHGGGNMYHPAKNATQADVRQLEADAKAWAQQFGWEDPFEAADLWIDWHVNLRPYGKTAADYLSRFADMSAPKM